MAHPEQLKSSSFPIDTPTCLECGTRMTLVLIEPEKPGHDRRTFECLDCGRNTHVVVQFRKGGQE